MQHWFDYGSQWERNKSNNNALLAKVPIVPMNAMYSDILCQTHQQTNHNNIFGYQQFYWLYINVISFQ